MADKRIVICDIDGTIANLEHRLHYIQAVAGGTKDWDSFHNTCVDDEPHKDVIEVLSDLITGLRTYNGNGCHVCGAIERDVYFFSGRNESVRSETIEWLQKHLGELRSWWDEMDWDAHLFMRSESDRRDDVIVKYEMMYEHKFTPDDVLCILDDRQRVVDMWRENGFRCLQVDAWKEPPKHHHLMDADLETLNTEELIFLIKHEREHYKARLDELVKRNNEKKRLLKEVSNARIDFAIDN